jgi:phosphoribosyl-ATP pyrophosphohydrolase
MNLPELYEIIEERKKNPQPNSYTCSLFEAGMEEISKKVGEEAIEVILAANQQGTQRTVEEIADLFYHVMVLMVSKEIPLDSVEKELQMRHSPSQ